MKRALLVATVLVALIAAVALPVLAQKDAPAKGAVKPAILDGMTFGGTAYKSDGSKEERTS